MELSEDEEIADESDDQSFDRIPTTKFPISHLHYSTLKLSALLYNIFFMLIVIFLVPGCHAAAMHEAADCMRVLMFGGMASVPGAVMAMSSHLAEGAALPYESGRNEYRYAVRSFKF